MALAERAKATREVLARLVTAATVVAILVLLIVPLCGNGMPATVHMAAARSPADPVGAPSDRPMITVNSSCAVVGIDPGVAECAAAPILLSSASGPSGPRSDAALLGCIAFLVAILAGVLGLRFPRSVGAATTRLPVKPHRRLARVARRSTLAELCLLRT